MPESKRSFMLMSPLSMETVTSVNPPELSAAQPFVNIWVHFAQPFRNDKIAKQMYFVILCYINLCCVSISVCIQQILGLGPYLFKADKLLWRMEKDERCLLFGWVILCIHTYLIMYLFTNYPKLMGDIGGWPMFDIRLELQQI